MAINSDLSALSIRATEYLQRWKEVVQFASRDYSDQMAAQFGIKAPEYMGNHAHYIGGWSNVININEVLNTNLILILLKLLLLVKVYLVTQDILLLMIVVLNIR